MPSLGLGWLLQITEVSRPGLGERKLLTKKMPLLRSSFAGYDCVSRHRRKRGQRVQMLSRSNRKRGSLTNPEQVGTAEAEVSPQPSPPLSLASDIDTDTVVGAWPPGLRIRSIG